MKQQSFKTVTVLSEIPNIGPAMIRDLALLGITRPEDMVGKDGYMLYMKLCEITGVRHDPCVLDTFLAITDFASGAPLRPWFWYTKGRKEKYMI